MTRMFVIEPWQRCARLPLRLPGSKIRWRCSLQWKPVLTSAFWSRAWCSEPGKPHGVALALMVRVKRPGTKVVFVAREENAPHTEGLGVFLPMPLNPDILVATVSRLLSTEDPPDGGLEDNWW